MVLHIMWMVKGCTNFGNPMWVIDHFAHVTKYRVHGGSEGLPAKSERDTVTKESGLWGISKGLPAKSERDMATESPTVILLAKIQDVLIF